MSQILRHKKLRFVVLRVLNITIRNFANNRHNKNLLKKFCRLKKCSYLWYQKQKGMW